MDKSNRPRSREKHVTGESKGVHKRGDGLHTGGPVGSGGPHGNSNSNDNQRGSGSSGSTPKRSMTRAGGAISVPVLIIMAIVYFVSGGGGLGSLGGGGSSSGSLSQTLTSSLSSSGGSSGWQDKSNLGKLDTSVASGAREKRTTIKGDGEDTITIMVYMCGTDLESRSGMATSDLQEMAKATLSDKINLIVYTGGCKQWKNSVISNKVNQIYQVKDGGLICLEKDMGTSAMTDPNNLATFIKWCNKNYPADRNELIFWDHGGGSLSGYGYDEKNAKSGSMSLSGINTALKKGGVTFDFIGFDACLMSTLENALMLTNYADYLIASEETEPGVGWYYTNWLTKLSKNTSMSTVEIGKNIVDDFVSTCNTQCKGQLTTLAVTDLAELEATVPSVLTDFSKATKKEIESDNYKTISTARNNTREFAQSSSIDQVDLIHLAKNIGSDEATALAKAVEGAVKYNLTSSNMTNAYGMSIYFPYRKSSYVDPIVSTYNKIGMDTEYTKCIQEFASLETCGQAATGGTSSPLPSLLGTLASSSGSSDMVGSLLQSFLSGDVSSVSGLGKSNVEFLDNDVAQNSEEYISNNQFDASKLTWTTNSDGKQVISLDEDQWSLVQSLELNCFYDDGEGYVDLGLDNVFDFDDDGSLIGENDHTWLAINGQPVAYYYLNTVEDGDDYTITGYVPAMLNGDRVEIMIAFDQDNTDGYVLGARTDYDEDETQTLAKGLTEIKDGDKIDFICDYYTYDGEYEDSYYLGDQMTVDGDLTISNVDVGEGSVKATYRFTDIYQQHYWTEPMSTQSE